MKHQKQPILDALSDGKEHDTWEISKLSGITSDTCTTILQRLVTNGVVKKTRWSVKRGRKSIPARWRLIPATTRPVQAQPAPEPPRQLSEFEQRWRDSGLGCASASVNVNEKLSD